MPPICVPCRQFYRPEKNGFHWLEGMPIGKDHKHHVLPGKLEPEYWKPYKLWNGDLWRCGGCGHTTIAGVPLDNNSEHYMPTFKDEVTFWAKRISCGSYVQLLPTEIENGLVQINDCY